MIKFSKIAIIGEPNAGKSTLLNRIAGAELAIVTPKVQTTRFNIRCSIEYKDSKFLFIDTPGLFIPNKKRALEKYIVKNAYEGVREANIILFMIDIMTLSWVYRREIEFLINLNNSIENNIEKNNSYVLKNKNIKLDEMNVSNVFLKDLPQSPEMQDFVNRNRTIMKRINIKDENIIFILNKVDSFYEHYLQYNNNSLQSYKNKYDFNKFYGFQKCKKNDIDSDYIQNDKKRNNQIRVCPNLDEVKKILGYLRKSWRNEIFIHALNENDYIYRNKDIVKKNDDFILKNCNDDKKNILNSDLLENNIFDEKNCINEKYNISDNNFLKDSNFKEKNCKNFIKNNEINVINYNEVDEVSDKNNNDDKSDKNDEFYNQYVDDNLVPILDELKSASYDIENWKLEDYNFTDISKQKIAEEITREAVYLNLKKELPYSVYVETEKWYENSNGIAIRQILYVAKDSQKNIVIGKNGSKIKEIGIFSRNRLKKIFYNDKIELFLFVKVKEKWMENINY